MGVVMVFVVLGFDKGVWVFSEFNMCMGLIFLIVMFILGLIVFLMDFFI